MRLFELRVPYAQALALLIYCLPAYALKHKKWSCEDVARDLRSPFCNRIRRADRDIFSVVSGLDLGATLHISCFQWQNQKVSGFSGYRNFHRNQYIVQGSIA